MGKITKRYKDTKLHLKGNEIVDPETGEFIGIGNSTLIKRTNTNQITINSKDYFYVDSQILGKLIKNIKQVDLALLFSISNNLLISHNICLDNDGSPLKTSKIGSLIGNTSQNVNRKLNRLINKGLLFYGYYKEFGKVYIVNPHIIRKGRYLSKNLAELFDVLK